MEGIKDFPIDHWIRKYAPICKVHLHGSSAPIISINELKQFHPDPGAMVMDYDLALDYGPFEGSDELRERVAERHSTPECRLDAKNVIITPGSILANFLVLDAICQQGDHIICQYPVFSQLHLLPQHRGVEVSSWQLMNDDDAESSIYRMQSLIRSNTKAIILNNPNNPTGAVITKEMLEQIVAMAREANITVFSDEVFQPLLHNCEVTTCPLVSLGYEHSVSSGSLSKVYGLPGVRVGWVVSTSKDLLRKVLTARDYTTTTVSRLDDAVATFALGPSVLPSILKRSLESCREGIELIDAFVRRNPRCSWSKPNGGATAFVRIYDERGHPVDEVAFCAALAEEAGLCVIPAGWCFRNDGTGDFKGYCRFPLGNVAALRQGLPILETFLKRNESHNYNK